MGFFRGFVLGSSGEVWMWMGRGEIPAHPGITKRLGLKGWYYERETAG